MVWSYGLALMMNYGHIRVYGGAAQPLDADYPPAGNLLGLVCSDGVTPIPDATAGGLQLALTGHGKLGMAGDNWVLKGLASGTPTWWRFVWNAYDDETTSDYYPRIDGAVGESLFLNSPTIETFTGEPINGFTLLLPTS